MNKMPFLLSDMNRSSLCLYGFSVTPAMQLESQACSEHFPLYLMWFITYYTLCSNRKLFCFLESFLESAF